MKKIVTITGASGAGKDSLLDAVMYCSGNISEDTLKGISRAVEGDRRESFPMRELLSHTTREPRPGEKNHVDYHFVSDSVFESLDKLESVVYAGNKYCLAADEISDLDTTIGCVIVDPVGLSQIKAYADKSSDIRLFKIFICVDADTSKKRMELRGDLDDKIQARLKQQSYRKEYIAPSDDFDLVLDGSDSFFDNVDKMYSALRSFSESGA